MLRRQVIVLLGFLLLGGAFVYGLVQLFNLRMEKGDVFPAYSTLRADPLGTKVLLDSLNGLPGMNAWRNYLPLPQLKTTGPVTLTYVGIKYQSKWEEKELPFFEALIWGGSRAVFAFAPEQAIDPQERAGQQALEQRLEEIQKRQEKKTTEKEKEKDKEKEERKKRTIDLAKPQGIPFDTVADKWGFQFEVTQRRASEPKPDFTVTGERAAYGLEYALPWHSELHFAGVKAPWKTLYSMRGMPVVIERPWGAGSIVLASDSYFLSNEGLYSADRAPELIAWALGSPRTIVFDESHLGVSEDAGISTLARKYRLHGFVAGLLLVAALFVWQNIVRFLPPQADADESDAIVTGRGSGEGFIVLLRRAVPDGQLLATCVAEWRRTFSHDTRALARLSAAWNPEKRLRKPAELVAAYEGLAKAVASKQ